MLGQKIEFHSSIVSLDKNRSRVQNSFGDYPVFYMPETFSEVDLQTLDKHIAEKID